MTCEFNGRGCKKESSFGQAFFSLIITFLALVGWFTVMAFTFGDANAPICYAEHSVLVVDSHNIAGFVTERDFFDCPNQ